ncbi:MAG TPA: glycosyltransferase [Vicinamibacteria bacterium]|nr:glycosyltransferase [Vicinamibacteria bacterium]
MRSKEIVFLLPGAGAALGDTLPLVRLGSVLADHGHSVTLVLAEKTRSALESSVGVDGRFGVEVFPERSDLRYDWVGRLPLPSRKLIAYTLVHVVPESFAKRDSLVELVRRRGGVDVVVGSCVGMEELSRSHPFARVGVGPSPYAVAVWKRPQYRAVWSFCAHVTDRLVVRPALERRGVRSLPWPSRSRVLGLWSPLLLDSGSAGRISWESLGFPPPVESALPAPLEAFLRAGPAPVVFSLGSYTASVGLDRVISTARDVADRLACRVVVTTLEPEASLASRELPDSITLTSFVNLDALLPRARALVHHGGIGTTACALRAGIPSVAAPMAFDQPFNARRCADLGAGAVVEPLTRVASATLAEAIASAAGGGHREILQRVSRRVRDEDGFAAAAARIEGLPARDALAAGA